MLKDIDKPEYLESNVNLELLKEAEELQMIKTLGQFPSTILHCVDNLEPCGITSYLQSLANDFHSFYDKHRVLIDDLELTKARLVLVNLVRIVISTGLTLLGISSPHKM